MKDKNDGLGELSGFEQDENSGLGELGGWAQRLEASAEDEATLLLTAQLREQRPPAPELPADFTAGLRRQLLDQYERRPAFDLRGVGRLMGSAVALGLLALAVVAAWLAMAQRPGAATDPQNTVTITRRSAEVIYDRLQVGLTTAEDMFVEGTAEFWQSGDGRLFRGQIVDDGGNVQVVVVTDGKNVVYGTRAEPAGGNWFLEGDGELTYTIIKNVEISVGEKAPHTAVLTLYRNLGWEGVVQVMIRPESPCADHVCVINQVSHPAPAGIRQAIDDGCDAWGASLIDTEEWHDGRQADIVQISYACSAVIAHEEGVSIEELDIEPAVELLPQRRIIKVDLETFELLEVSDYEGETVLRRIRRMERQWLRAADLPAGFFSTVLEGLEVITPDRPSDVNSSAFDNEEVSQAVTSEPASGSSETETESLETEPTPVASTGNRVWIRSITQHARNSKDAPITFEVVVGYELVSAPEAVLKLHYAAPDWETRQVNGRVPMDGMSDFVPVTADQHSVTFEFTGSPQEMAQIVGTENPVPVIQLGNFIEHDDDRGRELRLYAVETFAGYPFSLVTTDEIRYTGKAETRQTPTPEASGDHLAFVSILPPTSAVITGITPTTFEVQLHYRLGTLQEAEILVWMMPAGGGASLVVASEEVTAGEGEIELSFSFNPSLDLYAGEASEWRIFAVMGTFGESGGDSLASASPHDSLEDVWRYEP